MNVEAFKQLKRVLGSVSANEFEIGSWNACACGFATRDAWFREQGFTSCDSFDEAAEFFDIRRDEAKTLFSGARLIVTPAVVIDRIEKLIGTEEGARHYERANDHARRQAIIDELLTRANRLAAKARRVATALVTGFF